VLSGTPATDGEFNFAIRAEDTATDAVEETFDIRIVPAVAIATLALPSAVVGECYSATVTATGGLAPYTWTDIDSDLPSWASTGDNSDVVGCPGQGDEDVSPVTFTVTDSLGGTSSKTLDLVVAGGPTTTPLETPTATPTATPTEPSVSPTPSPSPTETATASPTATPTTNASLCVGSCNGDASVTINELITLVGIALETLPQSACMQGVPSGAPVDIALLVRAVGNALTGCAAA
jgi:hypothetical protein